MCASFLPGTPTHFLCCIPITNIYLNPFSDGKLTTIYSHVPLAGRLLSLMLRPNLCPYGSE